MSSSLPTEPLRVSKNTKLLAQCLESMAGAEGNKNAPTPVMPQTGELNGRRVTVTNTSATESASRNYLAYLLSPEEDKIQEHFANSAKRSEPSR